MLQAIPGTEDLEMTVYFPDYDAGSHDLDTIRGVENSLVVQRDGRYGYAEMTFHLDLPDESAMDRWAYDEVCKAIEAGLIPNELQNQYRTNITRADFALLMTEVAVTITGKDLETLVYDVTGKTLDVMHGYGNNTFRPTGTYTRQQAFVTAYRLMTQIVGDAA